MKTAKIVKELLIGCMVVSPLIYYFYLWNTLPAEIPIHFDAHGNPNNYGSRSYMAITLLFLSLGTYLFLLFIPKIDPKKNFSIFSDTFVKLRFILSLFFSGICFMIISSVKEGELNPSYIYIIIAILIMVMGNYMSNIRPNYFVGIRTPWALECETNWKKTHHMTSRLWFVSGIVLVVLVLVMPQNYRFPIFLGVIALISILPFLYSFYTYRKFSKTTNN